MNTPPDRVRHFQAILALMLPVMGRQCRRMGKRQHDQPARQIAQWASINLDLAIPDFLHAGIKEVHGANKVRHGLALRGSNRIL